ncbi:unnamed protein product [Urochloa humidicola]
MVENTHGSGRHAFGDLTNILCKRPALSDTEKSRGGIKVRRIENDTMVKKEFDENAMNSSRGKGIVFGNLFDGVAKGNFERPSIFRHTKVQHMVAKAVGLLSKEVSGLRDCCTSIDSFDLSDKEQDSSLDSESEYDEYDDEMNGELMGHFSSSDLANKTAANDGECLTQEEIVGSSGNQKPQSSLDFTTVGDMLNSSVQHASMRTGDLEEAVATKSCACSFCLKAGFMLADLLYQDTRSRLSVSKKSIRFAKSVESKKSKWNEYAANVAGFDSERAVGMEFELSQQQRSLFLYTENAFLRESTQLNSSFAKLKELREKCKTDLEMIGNSSLGK